ncbi:MAG: hypothetical protein P4N24_00845, partial [Acidobacteriota bacterium]|nr:hypothetical protein [Acidobacteriota bacterium]
DETTIRSGDFVEVIALTDHLAVLASNKLLVQTYRSLVLAKRRPSWDAPYYQQEESSKDSFHGLLIHLS